MTYAQTVLYWLLVNSCDYTRTEALAEIARREALAG
jgi:hypothetical protein